MKVYGVVKAHKSGGSTVFTIPMSACEELGINVGDSFVVSLGEKGLLYTKQGNVGK